MQAQKIDYAKLAEQARQEPQQATSGPAGPRPSSSTSAEQRWAANNDLLQQAGEATVRMGTRLAQNIVSPVTDPKGTAKAIATAPYHVIKSHMDEAQKAFDSFRRGDRAEGTLEAIASVIPIFGPMLDTFVRRTAQGEGPEVAADLSMFALPGALPKGGRMAVGGTAAATPEAQALRYVASEGVPVDLATQTGNSALRHVQSAAENVTLLGAKMAKRGQEATQQGLATLGEHLASQAGRGTPATMLGAGEEAARTLTDTVRKYGKAADAPYAKIRAAEQAGTVTGVNVGAFQQQLKPVYDQLVRESQLVAPQGATAKALVALDRLMQADKVAPLSIADGALGELKAALRKVGESEPWSKGAGALRQAVSELDKRVMETARVHKLDMDLNEGRAATIAKYNVAEVLEGLSKEPVKTVQAILSQKDRAVSQLRQIRQYAPEAVGEMGKAYLDDLLETATREKTFGSTDKIYAEWKKLGPATKHELFAESLKKDPNYLRNLDQFFLAAKALQKSMNPTGSGYAAASAMHGANLMRGGWLSSGLVELAGGGLSAALRSPTIAKLLTRGVTVPMPTQAAKAAYLASLAKAFQAEGLPVPAFASTQKDPQ